MNEYLMVAIGGFFAVLGFSTLVWGAIEEKKYFNSLMSRHDLREFLDHFPHRPEAGALKLGGLISMIIGGVLLVLSGIVLLQG